MNDYPNALLDRAICLLREGQPLPCDVTARLLEQGIDVEELTALYGA